MVERDGITQEQVMLVSSLAGVIHTVTLVRQALDEIESKAHEAFEKMEDKEAYDASSD